MSNFRDLTGERFGRLTVVSRAERPAKYQNRQFWLVRCDCGAEKVVSSSEWNRHGSMSCGCYQKEGASRRLREQKLTHGESGSRLYSIWNAMKQRCSNPNIKEYPLYGGRGIQVCKEWANDFPTFQKWMLANGYDDTAPRGKCTIDRIDVNGDYCPDNCRIATQKTQSNNRRRNRLITYNGETKTMTQWAEQYGISVGTLYDRLSYGWPIERCLTQPLRRW